MLLKYLNRKSNLDALSPSPCAQLVNVPQLQACTRCRFCRFNGNFDTPSEYRTCMQKHKCGSESLLYAYLHNSASGDVVPQSGHFSPSQVIKSTTIDNMTRYIQLWSCDLDGYECCRLCQFYAARVASDVSIAECSNSHACGRNGSWWDLLTLRDNELLTLPDVFTTRLEANQFYTLDGVLHNASFSNFVLDPYGFIVAYMSDGEFYYPMLAYKNSPLSWNVLSGDDDDPRTWSFSYKWNSFRNDVNHTLLITSSSNPIWQALQDRMFSEGQFLFRNLSWWRTTDSAQQRVLFNYVDSDFSETTVGSHILLTIKDVGNATYYPICNNGTLKFLGLPYVYAPKSKAKWVTLTSDQVNTLTYVTSRTMNTPSVKFLITAGLRESLFY